MKFNTLLSVAVATASIALAFPASAVPVNPVFTVNPGAGEAGSLGAFQANNLGGDYYEAITFTSATAFDVSLIFVGGTFSLYDTVSPKSYSSAKTGLGSNYGVYATFLGKGNYTTSGATTNFNLTFGNLTLVLDKDNDGDIAPAPLNGSTLYSMTNSVDDIILAYGSNTTGSGSSTGTTCPNNNCGSFGQTTQFALTTAGGNFFTAPNPFYNIALTSGQFQGVNPVVGNTVFVSGTANTVFNTNEVPEPSPLALVGLGLVALGFSRRISGKAKS